MKIQLFTIALLFGAMGLKTQQTNFSNTWIRNTEKCDPGNMSINSIPVRISIKDGAGPVEITRISKNAKGDTSTYTEILRADGSTTTTVMKPGLNKRSSVQWAADQRSFSETADYADDNGNLVQKIKDKWALGEDGKTLTIRLTLTTTAGTTC
jgi:hypothetical protein